MTFETKDEAIDALEVARADWLATARAVASKLGDQKPFVNVLDVRRAAPKLPDGIDPRVFGAIFRTPGWEFVTYRTVKRKTSHDRPIADFRKVF